MVTGPPCAIAAVVKAKMLAAPKSRLFGVRIRFTVPSSRCYLLLSVTDGKVRSALARNNNPFALIVDRQAKTAMQQQDEHLHIVRFEAAADTDAAGIAFDNDLAAVVTVVLLGRLCLRLLVVLLFVVAPG